MWLRTILIVTLAGTAMAGDRAELLRGLRATLNDARQAVDTGELDRAERLYRDAREDAAALSPSNLMLARAIDGLADVHRMREEWDPAAELYAAAIPMWRQLLGPDQPRLATTHNNLAVVHMKRGDDERAAPHLDRAIEIWEGSLDADAPELAEARRMRRGLAVP
jgi:tetratricopeptide (TPR) repeat protein